MAKAAVQISYRCPIQKCFFRNNRGQGESKLVILLAMKAWFTFAKLPLLAPVAADDYPLWKQVSVLPRCNNIASILDAESPGQAFGQLLLAAAETFSAIILESYLSLFALLAFFLMTLSFAKSGGIGAVPGQSPAAARLPFFDALAVR